MTFRLRSFSIFLLITIILAVSSLNAQYFGRNKVQYKTFDFKVLKTEHFDVYFYPEQHKAAVQAARMAERWYARFSRIFNHELRGRQPLIVYASSPDFQQTAAIPGVIGEGTGGVTEAFKRRIVLPLGASLAESDHVIGHELVHAFQFDITSQPHSSYATAAPTALRLPLWFIEGLAEYLSIGPVDPHTSMWMRDATQRDKLPSFKKLIDPQFFPYRYGQSLWAYITGRWGDSAVERIMKGVSKTGDYEKVIQKILGVSTEELSKDWHESLKDTYTPLSKVTEVSAKSSRPLFLGTKENPLNVSPAASPDGKQIVFLSTRDLFSIDLFLADAQTGNIERKLVSTAVNPHFESLQFIKSSGSWDSEGKRFVFGAISQGIPVLTLVDMESGRKEKEVEFPHMGEILNPTWSPDGRYIAFSALTGGFTDIFIYDLGAGTLKRMTDDSFGDLYPAWSPDGSSIAFTTERFSTNLSLLSIGDYELALMDPKTGEIKKVPGFPGAKNINPQWAPDSKSLYFLSDQNGISNIYRLELESGNIFQVTNLYTGASGITSLSPALSVGQKSGQLMYCFYREGRYSIYSIDSPEVLVGKRPTAELGQVNPSILPPRKKSVGELLGLLKNPLFGLPAETEFEINDYKPKLTLDYVTQPQLAIGVDRFGTYAGGGLAFYFSDMLGYHNLVNMVQISSRLEDSAALVGYQNSRRRLNWGAVAQRIPYVYGGYTTYLGNVFGELAIVQEEYIFRQINYQLSGFVAYPFNQVRRFELSGGYQFIDFDEELRTRAYSYYDGREIIDEKEDLDAPPGLHFGFVSGALVYDSSFWGATGPILGQSYRFEASPYLGSLNFANLLADYRRYFMPVRPFTLAFRMLHFGRFGKDGESGQLFPLYLGYESLVRGYNSGSFEGEEFQGKDAFDFARLYGSKLIVANAELRFPLFNVLGIGRGFYGILPIDFAAFFDAGIAWWDEDVLLDSAGRIIAEDRKAWFLGGKRKPITSAGLALRMNFFGYLVLGVSYVKPFQRPNKDWYFQFTITPGF